MFSVCAVANESAAPTKASSKKNSANRGKGYGENFGLIVALIMEISCLGGAVEVRKQCPISSWSGGGEKYTQSTEPCPLEIKISGYIELKWGFGRA